MDRGAPSLGQAGLVILGGGVAGLTASLLTQAPVYEADAEPGGAVASDHCEGFTFDRGIHVLQTKNQKILDRLQELGVDFAIIQRSAHIHAFGKDTAYPFQINSTNLRLDRRARCVWAFLRRASNPEPANYADWIYRSVGRGFGDTFLIPYSEKFWGVHPRDMSFEWTDSRVPKADVWQVLRGAVISRNTRVGTNATFRYPRGPGGYGTVSNVLRDAIGDKLHTGKCATHIDTGQRRIVFNDRECIDYRVLLSTIPLPVLIRIATGVPSELHQAVASLRTNSIMVVNLGIGRANITSKHWVHFPEKDVVFFRISFPHNFSADLAPPGTSSVSCEVSYPTGSPPDRGALVKRVTEDLIRVGVLRPDDKVVTAHTRDIPFGYCIYDNARRAALPVIYRWLDSIDIVPSGRYGLWTYFWSDEAMVSGEQAAEQALKRVQMPSSIPSGADQVDLLN
jgi:protoporphyrinogen oxidase